MATRSSLSSKKSLDLWLLHVHWIRALSQRCQDSPWGMLKFSYLTLEKKCFACLSLVQTDQESFREMVIPRILSESSSSTAFALKFLSPSCVGLTSVSPGRLLGAQGGTECVLVHPFHFRFHFHLEISLCRREKILRGQFSHSREKGVSLSILSAVQPPNLCSYFSAPDSTC